VENTQFAVKSEKAPNLPVAAHVLGARASRTTHPMVLKAFERLFSLLAQHRLVGHSRQTTAAAQAEADTSPVPNHQLVLALDAKSRQVVFMGGPRLGGVSFRLFEILVAQAQKDDTEGRAPSQHTYISVRKLQEMFDLDAEALRQRVAFARKKLGEQFRQLMNRDLDEEDLIETKQRRGYRLNPYVLIVDPDQVKSRTGSHGSSR
jgi:hypothetical protein